MKNLAILICSSIVFLSCDPCAKYKDEIYQEDSYHGWLDSTGVKNLEVLFKRSEEPEMLTLDYESYRFAFIHVFTDTLQLVRIEHQNSNYRFIHKKVIVDSVLTWILVEKTQKQLLAEEWRNLKELISQAGYWTLPKEIDRYGLDGGTYLIEGRRPDAENCGKRSYHIVSRWSPEEGGFQKLCEKFMEIVERKGQGPESGPSH